MKKIFVNGFPPLANTEKLEMLDSEHELRYHPLPSHISHWAVLELVKVSNPCLSLGIEVQGTEGLGVQDHHQDLNPCSALLPTGSLWDLSKLLACWED